MKNLEKTRIMCFIVATIGTAIWSVVLVLEGASVIRGLIIFVISSVAMNLLIWKLFKARLEEKND